VTATVQRKHDRTTRRGRRGPLPGSPRGPRLSKVERETQIIGIAEHLFGELGFANTTMDMVAQAAGITKPVIYDHFGSKEGLLAAVIDQARDELTGEIQQAWREVAHLDSAEASFRAGLVAYFTFMDAHAAGWRGLVRNGVSGIASTSIESARDMQALAVQQSLRHFPQLAAVPAPMLECTIEGLVGACERISIWRADRDDITPAAAADIVMAMCWSGLKGMFSTR